MNVVTVAVLAVGGVAAGAWGYAGVRTVQRIERDTGPLAGPGSQAVTAAARVAMVAVWPIVLGGVAVGAWLADAEGPEPEEGDGLPPILGTPPRGTRIVDQTSDLWKGPES